MKVYNEEKTQVLTEYDLSKGYLKNETITRHVPVTEAVEEVSHYEIVKEYPNGGKDVKKIIDVEGRKAVPEHNESEEIKVYVLYSEAELEKRRLNSLRIRRQPLLAAFDKWEKGVLRGREKDDKSVMAWYKAILELDEEAVKTLPERIQYYL